MRFLGDAERQRRRIRNLLQSALLLGRMIGLLS